jgi:hypothetical protein
VNLAGHISGAQIQATDVASDKTATASTAAGDQWSG